MVHFPKAFLNAHSLPVLIHKSLTFSLPVATAKQPAQLSLPAFVVFILENFHEHAKTIPLEKTDPCRQAILGI